MRESERQQDGWHRQSVSPVPAILLAIWFGMTAGLAELGIMGLRRFALGDFIHQSDQVVWMAPLADGIVVVLTVAIFLLASVRYPRLRSLGIITGVAAFPALLTVLLMFPRIHVLAVLILAGGLTRITVHLAGRDRNVRRLVRWGLAGSLTVVIVLALSINGYRWLSERRALGKLSEAAPGAPNVLLLILDTVRAESMSLYGNERRTTPNLDSLAAEGVVFEWAIATAPWTLVTHASLFTGRRHHELSTDWEVALDRQWPTVAQILAKSGYSTAGFAANMIYASREHGLDRGFAHYEDYLISPGQIVLSSTLLRRIFAGHQGGEFTNPLRRLVGNNQLLGRKRGDRVNRDFLKWLDGVDNRPFFAFLNYFDAHGPYLPPAPYDGLFEPQRPRADLRTRIRRALKGYRMGQMSGEAKEAEEAAYEGAIAFLDAQVVDLLKDLDRRGILGNTLVVITSDHGEEFFEHDDLFSHGGSLYIQGLRVPMVMLFPGHIPRGEAVSEPVSLADFPATLLDLIGLDRSVVPGESWARLWTDPQAPVTGTANTGTGAGALSMLTEEGQQTEESRIAHSLVRGDYHYILEGDGTELLYDLASDPAEERDLAATPEYSGALEAMRDEMSRELGDSSGRSGDPVEEGEVPR